MNYDLTVHTAVALQNIWPDRLQIGTEKIRFHVVCAVYTVMRKTVTNEQKKNCSLDLGHICLQSERTHSQTKDEFQMVFMFPWRALQEGDTIWRVIPDKKKMMLFFIARISLPPHETLLPSSHQSPHFKWAGHREINFTFTH